MFPHFVEDDQSGATRGLQTIFAVECASAADYAKVLFWGFIAGFSEKFATNIIGQFESRGLQEKKPEAEVESLGLSVKKLEVET